MNDKYIVVTGAAGGIGSHVCTTLADSGYAIFALDKNDIGISKRYKGSIIPVKVDFDSIASINEAAKYIKSQTSQLHGIINIAGIFDQFPLMEVDHDRFNQLINTNFVAHHHLTRMLFPLLHEAKGRIINLSSETVLSPMPLQSYAFSKKLFEAWSDQLKIELELLGIKVIKIRAGGHKTPFIDISLEVLSKYDSNSLYSNLYEKIKSKGSSMLKNVKNDPLVVAQVIQRALKEKNPSHLYHVNVSVLFRVLSMLPQSIREMLMIWQLKKWM